MTEPGPPYASGRAAVAYLALVFLAGMAALGSAVVSLASAPPPAVWLVLAASTVASSVLSMSLPRASLRVSLSETFVFLILLMFGGPAAMVTVSLEGLVSSLTTPAAVKRLRRLIFNVSEPAISIWVANAAFQAVSTRFVPSPELYTIDRLVAPTIAMSLAYLVANVALTATVVSLDTGEPAWNVARRFLRWVTLGNFSGASLSLLLAIQGRHNPVAAVAVALPVMLLVYVTFRTSINRVEEAGQHLEQLNRLHVATLESLAMAIDAKDQVTHGHIRRVQQYAGALAGKLGLENELELRAIEAAALLHDMGKVAIPDYILNKPGRLTPAEYERMKLHTIIGADILAAIDFPFPVVPIVRHHHENWNGTGYPDGLAGDVIPLGARILAVIDCYDALTSDRPYRKAMSSKDALDIVIERSGTMYDPTVVEAFLALVPALPATLSLDPGIHKWLPAAARQAGDLPMVSRPPSLAEQILEACDATAVLGLRATVDDASALVARRLRRLTPAGLVVVYAREQDDTELGVVHASGVGEEFVDRLRIAVGHGLSGWVAAHGACIRNSSPTLELAGIEGLPEFNSVLSVPLVSGGQSVGVLALYAEGRDAFTTEHEQIAQLAANPLATALRHGHAFEAERRSSLTDEETGLPNAQYLAHVLTTRGLLGTVALESLGVLAIRATTLDEPAAAGAVGPLLVHIRASLRTVDLIIRTGPSEFVVLLPWCNATLADEIVGHLSGAENPVARPPVGLAIGLARAPLDGDSLSELVQAAWSRLRRSTGVADPMFDIVAGLRMAPDVPERRVAGGLS